VLVCHPRFVVWQTKTADAKLPNIYQNDLTEVIKLNEVTTFVVCFMSFYYYM